MPSSPSIRLGTICSISVSSCKNQWWNDTIFFPASTERCLKQLENPFGDFLINLVTWLYSFIAHMIKMHIFKSFTRVLPHSSRNQTSKSRINFTLLRGRLATLSFCSVIEYVRCCLLQKDWACAICVIRGLRANWKTTYYISAENMSSAAAPVNLVCVCCALCESLLWLLCWSGCYTAQCLGIYYECSVSLNQFRLSVCWSIDLRK